MNELVSALEQRLTELAERVGRPQPADVCWQTEAVPANAQARLLARLIAAGDPAAGSDVEWAVREGARRLQETFSFEELADRLSMRGRMTGGAERRQLVAANAIAAFRDLARAAQAPDPAAGEMEVLETVVDDPFSLFDQEEERERELLAERLQPGDRTDERPDRAKLVRRAVKRIRDQTAHELERDPEDRTRARLEALASELRQVADATALSKPQLPLLVVELLSEQELVSAYTWRPFVRDWVSRPENRVTLEGSLAALLSGGDPAARISEFDALMPDDALTPDQGQRASLGSLFLFGAYGALTPVFRPAQARKAYHALGERAPKRGASAEERYRFYLGFLDRLLELAREHELPLADRLDAAVAAGWLADD